MKKLLFTLTVLLLLCQTRAQTLSKAEYFIDTDPGPGNGVPITITPGTTASFTATVPVGSLPQGFHSLAIRTQQSTGEWGLYEYRGFYVTSAAASAANITAAEFFIDKDPGPGSGTAVNLGTGSDNVNFVVPVPTNSLEHGFHTLGIRTRNAAGEWGLYELRGFYISPSTTNMANIVAAEYFLDTDPGVGNGIPLTFTTSGQTVNQVFSLPLPPGTASGAHTFALRVRDANGVWGLFDTARVMSTLPLDWVSFSGQRVGEKTVLDWTTENEINTSHFVVERSRNGLQFDAIAQTTTKGGTQNAYTYHDNSPLKGLNYYRLKQVDRDGQAKYSIIIKVYFGVSEENTLRVYPTPATGTVFFEFGGTGENVSLQVYDAGGRLIRNERLRREPVMRLSVDALAKGTYWLVLSDGINRQKGKIVKQ